MNKRAKSYKSQVSLPSCLYEVIIGLMLGDCCAYKRYPNSVPVLRFCQGAVHKDYLFHLFDIFAPYVATPPKSNTVKKGSSTYEQWSFQTLSFPFFGPIYTMFYIEGKKVVPTNVSEVLTEKGLAYWFFDDGAKAGKGFLSFSH